MGLAPAFASKKDDDYKKAKAAEDAGNSAEAARLYCALRDEDEKFKDVAAKCNMWADVMKKLRQKDMQRMAEGEQAFKEGRYDDAEQKFRNVTVADLAAQAKEYLTKINAARAAAADAAASDSRFQQATNAYNSNDLEKAKSLFSGVTGSRAGEARGYVDRISRYERAMSEGKQFADAKSYREAAAIYREAASIKSDGPGDPRGSAAQMDQLLAAANAPHPSVATSTSASNAAATTAGGANPATPSRPNVTPPSNPKSAAVKLVTPASDVTTLVREAEAAKATGDIGVAKGKYLAALAAEPNNAKVRAALSALPQAPAGSSQAAGAEADAMLLRAISEFYTGEFEASDVHIGDYLSANGAKTGLAYFYRGAGKLSRYYLNGTTQDKKLLMEARTAFQQAKQIAGFHPPDQKYVSPKVLDFYQSAQ